MAERQLSGGRLSRDDALAVLHAPDEEVLTLVAAAGSLRRAHFGDRVKLNYLVNLKSGLCPEDCSYCSQRARSDADILKYSWLPDGEAIEQVRAGISAGASRVCLVASGRGPSGRDIERVAALAAQVKAEDPAIEVCACLGLLQAGQADRLQAAGVDAYNHNINTSESHYGQICTTHEYGDRLATIDRAREAGLSPCSGLIVGMGESDDDIVDAVFALREIGSESIPVNFLMPFEGTPLAGSSLLDPLRCLRILAMVRFACPATEIRMAGGREMHLRSMQPLALHLANSMFLGDYLTSEGQAARADLQMIAEAGFRVLSEDGSRVAGSGVASEDGSREAGSGVVSEDGSREAGSRVLSSEGDLRAPDPALTATVAPRVRLRGAGTRLAPNA